MWTRFAWMAVLAGCATAVPYAPRNSAGDGYSELQLADNVFRVTYSGSSDPERTSAYALLRSADLTLEKGFRYFVVGSTESGTRVGSVGTNVFSSGVIVDTIVCYAEKPAGPALVYDARSVGEALHAKYDAKQPARSELPPSR